MEHDPVNPNPDAAPDPFEAIVRRALHAGHAKRGGASENLVAGSGPCPDAATLAAFVDGRLDASERQAFETHLADCGECLAACLLARRVTADDRAEGLEAPPSVIARARALVPHGQPPPRVLVFDAWRLVGRWGLAAAASLAICLAGYHFGQASCVDRTSASDILLTEMTFGVLDDESADESFLDAFALVTEEPS